MGLKERREREKKELREKLLASARCIFAEKGYHSVTIRDIAKLTEYSVPTIYSYFKDKQAMMIELVQNDIAEIQRMALESAHQKSTAEEQLREMSLSLINYLKAHPEQYRFLFQSFMSDFPDQAIQSDLECEAQNFVRGCMTKILGRPLSDEEFHLHHAILIIDIHGILGLLHGKLAFSPDIDTETLFNIKWNSFLNYLKAQG